MASERIDIHDYSGDQPELICSFFWNDQAGLSCTSPDHQARLEAEGIPTPPDGLLVFPSDGKKFFAALPAHFTGLVRASEPRPVAAAQ